MTHTIHPPRLPAAPRQINRRPTSRRWLVPIGAAVLATVGLGTALPANASADPQRTKTFSLHNAGTLIGTLCFAGGCDGNIFDVSGGGHVAPLGRYFVRAIVNPAGILTNDYQMQNATLRSTRSQDLPADDVQCNPGEIPGKSINTWTGGTGRFAGATGNYLSRSCLEILGDPTVPGGAPVNVRFWDDGVIEVPRGDR
jgi:hypothetical protein